MNIRYIALDIDHPFYSGIPTGSLILRKTKMVDFLYYKTGGMK